MITTPTTINGEVIPAGTYINDAFIHNAQITSAAIGEATITTANIAEGNITSASIADALYSANWFASGNSGATTGLGWNINSANGYAFFQNIICKGIIEATSLILSAGAEVRTLQIAGNAVTVPTFIKFTFPQYYVSAGYTTPVDGSNNAVTRTYVRASGGRLLVTCTIGVLTNTGSDQVEPNLYARLKVGNQLESYAQNLGVAETHVSVPSNGSTAVNVRVTATLSVATSQNHGTPDADENYLYTPELIINVPLTLSTTVFSTNGGSALSSFDDPEFTPNQYYACTIVHATNPAITEDVTVVNKSTSNFQVFRSAIGVRQTFPTGSKLTRPSQAFPNDFVSIELQVRGNSSLITSCDFTVISCKR